MGPLERKSLHSSLRTGPHPRVHYLKKHRSIGLIGHSLECSFLHNFWKKASRRIPWSSEVLALRPEPQSSFACFFCLSEERRGTNFTISSVLQRCVGCPLQEHSTSEHLPSLLSNRASLTKRRTIITEDNSVDKWVVHPPDSTQPVCDQIRPPWTAPPQTLVGGGGRGAS